MNSPRRARRIQRYESGPMNPRPDEPIALAHASISGGGQSTRRRVLPADSSKFQDPGFFRISTPSAFACQRSDVDAHTTTSRGQWPCSMSNSRTLQRTRNRSTTRPWPWSRPAQGWLGSARKSHPHRTDGDRMRSRFASVHCLHHFSFTFPSMRYRVDLWRHPASGKIDE